MAAAALSPLPANWATGAYRPRKLAMDAAHPTQFEIVVARLKLADAPHLWPYSPQLQAWAKANKNGSRDMRFVNNHQIPIVRYASLTLKSESGLWEEFQFSNPERLHRWISGWNAFVVSFQP